MSKDPDYSRLSDLLPEPWEAITLTAHRGWAGSSLRLQFGANPIKTDDERKFAARVAEILNLVLAMRSPAGGDAADLLRLLKDPDPGVVVLGMLSRVRVMDIQAAAGASLIADRSKSLHESANALQDLRSWAEANPACRDGRMLHGETMRERLNRLADRLAAESAPQADSGGAKLVIDETKTPKLREKLESPGGLYRPEPAPHSGPLLDRTAREKIRTECRKIFHVYGQGSSAGNAAESILAALASEPVAPESSSSSSASSSAESSTTTTPTAASPQLALPDGPANYLRQLAQHASAICAGDRISLGMVANGIDADAQELARLRRCWSGSQQLAEKTIAERDAALEEVKAFRASFVPERESEAVAELRSLVDAGTRRIEELNAQLAKLQQRLSDEEKETARLRAGWNAANEDCATALRQHEETQKLLENLRNDYERRYGELEKLRERLRDAERELTSPMLLVSAGGGDLQIVAPTFPPIVPACRYNADGKTVDVDLVADPPAPQSTADWMKTPNGAGVQVVNGFPVRVCLPSGCFPPYRIRDRLPTTRRGEIHKFTINGHEGYMTVGLYPNGQPGEMFIRISKEGSTLGGLLDLAGMLISIGLQFGVPLEVIVEKLTATTYEPNGMTLNPDIPRASSIGDYVGAWLGQRFLGHPPRKLPPVVVPLQVPDAPDDSAVEE